MIVIAMLLVTLCAGCRAVNYEKFTVDDIPVVVRHFARDDGSNDYVMASRSLPTIGSMDGGVDAIILLLNDEDDGMRSDAALTLGYMVAEGYIDLDENPALIPSLIDLLNDENPDVRLQAIETIASCALPVEREDTCDTRSGDSCTPRTIKTLQNEYIKALPAIVAGLTGVLDDEDEHVREAAVNTLKRIEPYAGDVIDDLPSLLIKYGDFFVRLDAATDLAESGENADAAVPVLIDCIVSGETYLTEREDESVNLQYYPIAGNCAYCLGLIGSDAVAAIPELTGLLRSENITERQYAIDAIVQIDPDGEVAVPILIDLLRSEDPQVCESSAIILGILGPNAEDALPALNEMLDDESVDIRREVVTAIELIDAGEK